MSETYRVVEIVGTSTEGTDAAIRSGIEKRLADSLEVAFKYGQDLLKVERLDGAKEQAIYFSQRFACVECGISYPEITPRMFSFNSPHGACPECSGIGSIMYFDPDLVIQNEELSISDGAIAPPEPSGGFVPPA